MPLTPIHFEETECAVGGVYCGAWNDWFDACTDADPSSIDEERDPALITNFPFQTIRCRKPDHCPLHAKSISATRAGAESPLKDSGA